MKSLHPFFILFFIGNIWPLLCMKPQEDKKSKVKKLKRNKSIEITSEGSSSSDSSDLSYDENTYKEMEQFFGNMINKHGRKKNNRQKGYESGAESLSWDKYDSHDPLIGNGPRRLSLCEKIIYIITCKYCLEQ